MDRDGSNENFLATDRVPDTLFGFRVVQSREDYTDEDLEFFKENPRAGGYYDLGDYDRDPMDGAIAAEYGEE